MDANITLIQATEFLQGPQGASGNQVLSGVGAPAASLGQIGNFYIDTSTSESYGPKTANGWGSPKSNIYLGLQGIQGPRGIAGPISNLNDPITLTGVLGAIEIGTSGLFIYPAVGGEAYITSTEAYIELPTGDYAELTPEDGLKINTSLGNLVANLNGICATAASGAYVSVINNSSSGPGFEADDASGNFIKAYPSSLTVQNSEGTNIVFTPTSLTATSSSGGSASINSNGHLNIATSEGGTVVLDESKLEVSQGETSAAISNLSVDVSSTSVNIVSSVGVTGDTSVTGDVSVIGNTNATGEVHVNASGSNVDVTSDSITVSKSGNSAVIDSTKVEVITSASSVSIKPSEIDIVLPDATGKIDPSGLKVQSPAGYVYLSIGSEGSLETAIVDSGSGASVTINIPTDGSGGKINASWKEIDICVNGEAKKMKVLGTAPY